MTLKIEFKCIYKMELLKRIKESTIFYESLGIVIVITIKLCNYYILGNLYIISRNNIIESISFMILTLFIINCIKNFCKNKKEHIIKNSLLEIIDHGI